MFFSYPPKFLQELYPSLSWKKECGEKKVVYLTFDDGPTEGVTELALDLLKKYNAKATFFCVGRNVENSPKLFQRILEENHKVGNHTFSHLNGWKVSSMDYLNDIEKCNEIFKSDLFRPPYGKMKSAQIKILRNKYKIVMWSVLTRDYDTNVSKELCLEIALKKIKPGNIFVFHDSIKAKDKMLYALEGLLKKLSEEGWECATL